MSKFAKIIAGGLLVAMMTATAAQADDHWRGDRGWHGGYDRGWHGNRDHWRGPPRVVYVPPPPPRVVYRPYPVYYAPYYAPSPPVVYRSSGFGFWFD